MDKHLVRRLVILAAFLSVLFGGLYGWHLFIAGKIRQAIAGRGPQAVTVSAAPVRRTDWASELSATASLVAVQGTMLTPAARRHGHGHPFRLRGDRSEGPAAGAAQRRHPARRSCRTTNRRWRWPRPSLPSSETLYKRHNTSQLALQEAETRLRPGAGGGQARIARPSPSSRFARPSTGISDLRQVSLGQYVRPPRPVVDLQQWNPIYADVPDSAAGTLPAWRPDRRSP